MAAHNLDTPPEDRIEFRVGVNLGDVLFDDDDILGDGVNVASRLEAICEPGGVCVSDVVFQIVDGKLPLGFRDLGVRHLKNLSRPLHVWQWHPAAAAGPSGPDANGAAHQQRIGFCRAPDGANIAYAIAGQGPPLFKAPNWMHHLEYDWKSPVWRHLLRVLADRYTLVRFDLRGNGLSDWTVPEISFDAHVSDLATVADAAGLQRFPLLGISQGCAISIAYAVRHPERVSRLVLYGGFSRGFSKQGEGQARRATNEEALMLEGWGRDNPAFRQYFTTSFMPGATREQMDWFNELQRITTSPENAVRLRRVSNEMDISDLLGRVSMPALVLHCRDDGIVPFEEGRRMAALIPGARFVPLEGQNHLILENEPAWPRFTEEVMDFLAQDGGH